MASPSKHLRKTTKSAVPGTFGGLLQAGQRVPGDEEGGAGPLWAGEGLGRAARGRGGAAAREAGTGAARAARALITKWASIL